MSVFALEHKPVTYIADFVFYGVLTSSLAVLLVMFGLGRHEVQLAAIVAAGAIAWTLLEYAIHRFVLHGLRPFSRSAAGTPSTTGARRRSSARRRG